MIALVMLPLYGKLPNRPFFWADDERFKPLVYQESAGVSKGILYEILKEAFKRMHIPLQNRLYPWSRVQKMVKEGSADGMVTLYTKARQQFLEASDPVVVLEEKVFTSRKNPKFKEIMEVRSIDDLAAFKIAETSNAGWSKERLKGMRIIWVSTPESALNMVALGRADIYLMSNYVGLTFVKDQIEKGGPLKEELKEIVMGSHPLEKMEYRLLIRKDSPYVEIIGRLNKVLHQMHRDGSYEKITNRYLRKTQNGSVASEL